MYFAFPRFPAIMVPSNSPQPASTPSITGPGEDENSALNQELAPERRHSLRQRVNTPAFASFDGVTGGMILDLSEEGMAMQTLAPPESNTRVPLHISLGEPAAYLETTGYVAWADALGRAGVRFSDLPEEARARLRQWLTQNASTPSWKAPRWVVCDSAFGGGSPKNQTAAVALNLETESSASHSASGSLAVSTTVQ